MSAFPRAWIVRILLMMSVLKARLEDIRELIADIDDIDIEDPW